MWKTAISALAVVAISACGGGGGSGSTPTTPSPSLATLSITPATDLIKIKGTETFTATGSFSDGTSRAVEATWGSDNTAVATVSGGRVTGVAPGQATIFADYQGQRATRLLRVVPDYHGRWSGDHRQTACVEEGDWKGVCKEFFPADSLYALTLAVTQTRDTVSSTVDFGDGVMGPVQGSIRMSGHLVLEGTFTVTSEGVPLEVTMSRWETLTTDNERMSGSLAATFRASGLQGSIRLECELRIVAKTSATPLLAGGSGGDSALRQHLSAALRAVRARNGR